MNAYWLIAKTALASICVLLFAGCIPSDAEFRERVAENIRESADSIREELERSNNTVSAEEFDVKKVSSVSIGSDAPNFAGKDIFGKEMALTDFRGKVVLIHHWAHW